VRIREEDTRNATFRTRYGHYDILVVSFGLTNSPSDFICLMNRVFIDYLEKIVIVFLDDILFYSKIEKAHDNHLRMVLHVLREHQLYVKLSKYTFFKKKIHYLGHIVLEDGIKVDLENIEVIRG
jgi:hypothetical protein